MWRLKLNQNSRTRTIGFMYSLTIISSQNDFHFPDWIPVEANANIDFDLVASPLEIKSSSGVGSNDEIGVSFLSGDTDDEIPTILTISLTSSPSYKLFPCHLGDGLEFDVDIPSAETYIWRISLEESQEGTRKFLLHCNELELVNVLVNDICQDQGLGNVAQIVIMEDEAAQYYRAYSTPGRL